MTSLPPNTTAEQDLRTHGQRKINLIWEYTQSGIAISLVLASIFVSVHAALQGTGRDVPDILKSGLFLVLGFYFGRTNHARIGDHPMDDRKTQ